MQRTTEEFEQVAMPHARSLLAFARRLTADPQEAEDVVQEALLLAWRGFGQVDNRAAVRAWLFRILINVHYGRHRRKTPQAVELTPAIADKHVGGSEHLEVTQALGRLPAEQRTALMLAVVEGFTCREISAILHVPIGTVMSRLSRAREAMREVLTAPCPGEGAAR